VAAKKSISRAVFIRVAPGAEFSLPGLLCVLAVPIMYFLSRRKLTLAETLGSRALKADAAESITCGWLSLVVVAALFVQLAIGTWWVDAVASLGIVWFLIREGREAWSGVLRSAVIGRAVLPGSPEHAY